MKSAGNDIVALNLVDKQRTCEARFYSKILSTSEQALYHQPTISGIPFENYVWLLWSVKESAYKYLKRADPGLVFSPTKITIEQINVPAKPSVALAADLEWESNTSDELFYNGTVAYGPNTLYFRSKITADWIATVVNGDNKFKNVCFGVQSVVEPGYYAQSTAAKALLLNKLSAFLPGDLRIHKSDAGFPIILNGAEDSHIPASLAHHGRFVAYSFIKATSTVLSDL